MFLRMLTTILYFFSKANQCQDTSQTQPPIFRPNSKNSVLAQLNAAVFHIWDIFFYFRHICYIICWWYSGYETHNQFQKHRVNRQTLSSTYYNYIRTCGRYLKDKLNKVSCRWSWISSDIFVFLFFLVFIYVTLYLY